ncbi:MAG TPA: hypothetical protein VF064_04755, partial [Pyrinomonadaceae bacterium]
DAQYVAALVANAGAALDAATRDQLVAALAEGRLTRADVLRAVADDAGVKRAETNKAFVLMQYFGYLRRDPDAPDFRGVPDPNLDGWRFWLSKLEEYGGNYERAEMVRAFLLSIEYRQRFGQ